MCWGIFVAEPKDFGAKAGKCLFVLYILLHIALPLVLFEERTKGSFKDHLFRCDDVNDEPPDHSGENAFVRSFVKITLYLRDAGPIGNHVCE
jgi:hypothetical protein